MICVSDLFSVWLVVCFLGGTYLWKAYFGKGLFLYETDEHVKPDILLGMTIRVMY